MKQPIIKYHHVEVIPDSLKRFDHNAFLYIYSVDGVMVRAIHWSGRYDGPVHRLAAHMRYLCRHYDADYITTTETQNKGSAKAIKKAFGIRRGRRNVWGFAKTREYVTVFNKTSFVKCKTPRVHTKVLTNVSNFPDWRQFHIGIFTLRHREIKRRFRLIVVHGPAGIEHGSEFLAGRASTVAQIGWRRTGRILRRYGRRNPNAVQIVVGDANGDHFRDFWIDYFERALSAPSVWRTRRPKNGTHGGRLIDGAWIPNAKVAE